MNCRKGIFEKRMVDNFIVLIKGRHSLSGIMNLLSTEKKKKENAHLDIWKCQNVREENVIKAENRLHL